MTVRGSGEIFWLPASVSSVAMASSQAPPTTGVHSAGNTWAQPPGRKDKILGKPRRTQYSEEGQNNSMFKVPETSPGTYFVSGTWGPGVTKSVSLDSESSLPSLIKCQPHNWA